MSNDGSRTDKTNRRGFLKSIGTASVAGGLATLLADRDIAQPVAARDPADPGVFAFDADADPDATFPQSVASGGPTPSGVILWTRVAPDAVVDGEPLGVQVAADDDFGDLRYEGTVPASEITAAHDYTVKVDLDGELDADRHYHYRFVYDGVATRTGRCRTLPAPDASPDSLSLAVLTCQDYQNGYYGAYHHLAQEDVDFVVHLGDFIYESADGAYTAPGDGVADGRDLSLPSGASLAESVADFRSLYRTYRADELLQEGQERHTFIYGWDDHEVGNNRYWDYDADAPVIPDKDGGKDPEFAMQVTADGIQAWVEHVPARVQYDPEKSDLQEQFQLWRDFAFGDLLDLSVTDERLFRDGPPCSDGQRVSCTDEEAEGRTMLGTEQKRWWKDWVASSEATWTAWANEVLTMPLTAGDGFDQVELIQDSWDGFQYERWELMQHIKDVDPQNFVALTGDLHCALAGRMKEGYGEIEWWELEQDEVGVEFMTPSVTSVNAAEIVDFPGDWDRDALATITKEENDHLEFVDWYKHGYAVLDFTREDVTYTVHEVDIEENSRDASKETYARYRSPNGRDTLEELYSSR